MIVKVGSISVTLLLSRIRSKESFKTLNVIILRLLEPMVQTSRSDGHDA